MNYATTSGMANPLTPAAEDQRFTALAPKRVQLSRAKGWRMPENTLKVTRPMWNGRAVRYEPPNVAGNRLARQGQSELTGVLGPGSEAR